MKLENIKLDNIELNNIAKLAYLVENEGDFTAHIIDKKTTVVL